MKYRIELTFLEWVSLRSLLGLIDMAAGWEEPIDPVVLRYFLQAIRRHKSGILKEKTSPDKCAVVE